MNTSNLTGTLIASQVQGNYLNSQQNNIIYQPPNYYEMPQRSQKEYEQIGGLQMPNNFNVFPNVPNENRSIV